MEKKVFRAPLKLKEGNETGEFTAVFSTLNVVDLDGDVTCPGAFRDGQKVRIAAWGHNWGDMPVGRGMIHADDEKAWVDGKFFLDTESGRETYRTVKNLGELQEWSYGFDIIAQSLGKFEGQDVRFLERLEVFEVSPVMLGAGIGTHTEQIKAALASHSTDTTDAAWNGPANEARVRSGESEPYYRQIYAWRDPGGDPAVKSSYRFIHHMVNEDGTPGAANIRGCQIGIVVLNGSQGEATTIPDADRQEVWSHLARHLRDGGQEPPELEAAGDQAGEGEGQAGEGEPSVLKPHIVLTGIEIELLEV